MILTCGNADANADADLKTDVEMRECEVNIRSKGKILLEVS